MTIPRLRSADHVSLQQIAQLPCIRGIVGTLEGLAARTVCTLEQLLALKAEVEVAGFTLDVIESIPVAEEIKLGLPERDAQIEAYCESIRNMGQAGIRVLCYNF